MCHARRSVAHPPPPPTTTPVFWTKIPVGQISLPSVSFIPAEKSGRGDAPGIAGTRGERPGKARTKESGPSRTPVQIKTLSDRQAADCLGLQSPVHDIMTKAISRQLCAIPSERLRPLFGIAVCGPAESRNSLAASVRRDALSAK
ncbi:hypothetical protein AOLI_G00039440 [Acnodon oligacanthus]